MRLVRHAIVLTLGFFLNTANAEGSDRLQIATLHPLLGDLASNIGGSAVDVWSAMPPGADPHSFQPSPKDLIRLGRAQLILASGKNLEPFLEKLLSNLQSKERLVEVGRTIPSLRISAQDELFVCCPAHSAGAIDPHWWHSVPNWRKATRIVADAMVKAAPHKAPLFRSNAVRYDRELEKLHLWAKSELATIPREARVLATAHLAFSYLCAEYGLRSLPVHGLQAEDETSAKYLSETIAALKKNRVRAIFPEQLASSRVVKQIAGAANVKVAPELIADGTAAGVLSTYEGMMRHNVTLISRYLRN